MCVLSPRPSWSTYLLGLRTACFLILSRVMYTKIPDHRVLRCVLGLCLGSSLHGVHNAQLLTVEIILSALSLCPTGICTVLRLCNWGLLLFTKIRASAVFPDP
jgi:hypothetical protein